MKKIALLGLLAVMPSLAQQPKFDLADVHVSPTAYWFAQNRGGSIRDGLYINRDATNIGTMVNCKNITTAEFASNLEQITGFFDHPIVDETGLQGGWSFLLGWSRQRPPQAPNPNQPAGAVADVAEPSEVTAYDAVQKELGLKLMKQKRSIPVIVVDHLSEKPTE